MRHRRGGGGRVGGGSIGHFCWFFHHRILSVRLYIIDVSPQSLRRFRSFQSFQWLLRMTPSLLSLRRQINHFSFFIFPLFHSILLLLALPSGQHSPETLKKEPQIIYGRYVNVDYHPKSFISERCGANVNEFFTTTQPKKNSNNNDNNNNKAKTSKSNFRIRNEDRTIIKVSQHGSNVTTIEILINTATAFTGWWLWWDGNITIAISHIKNTKLYMQHHVTPFLCLLPPPLAPPLQLGGYAYKVECYTFLSTSLSFYDLTTETYVHNNHIFTRSRRSAADHLRI